MKVKTNLSSKELVLVSKGLASLATKSQVDGKFKAANTAESELVSLVGDCVDDMLVSFSTEIKDLFNE